jgi:hypothetical protein
MKDPSSHVLCLPFPTDSQRGERNAGCVSALFSFQNNKSIRCFTQYTFFVWSPDYTQKLFTTHQCRVSSCGLLRYIKYKYFSILGCLLSSPYNLLAPLYCKRHVAMGHVLRLSFSIGSFKTNLLAFNPCL